MSRDLAVSLTAMNEAVDQFGRLAPLLKSDAPPFYAVGGLVLAVTSFAELVVIHGLETHSVWADARGADESADLISPDILKYVRSLITAPRLVDAEVGLWR